MEQKTITREEFNKVLLGETMNFADKLSKEGGSQASIAIMLSVIPIIAEAEKKIFSDNVAGGEGVM